ncbi:MAG: hypothetical protein AAF927_31055 [Bacteroidota bacterium]
MHRLFFYALIIVGLALEAYEKPKIVPECAQIVLPQEGELTETVSQRDELHITPCDIAAVREPVIVQHEFPIGMKAY